MASDFDLKSLGLTDEEVLKSRKQHGENILTPAERPSWIKLYLEKFEDPIIRILLIAATLSLIIGFFENEYIETIGIIIAILLATGVGFFFELDASRKFDILNALEQEEPCTTIRNNQIVKISRSKIVVGDIIILQQGEEIPADGELLDSIQLVVDESSLTGEPSTRKFTASNIPEDIKETTYPPYMVYRSSKILEGHAVIKITAVGDKTEIGHVAKESAKTIDVPTPLRLQLDRLAELISKVSIAVSTLIFIICTTHGIYHYLSLLPPEMPIDWIRIGSICLNYFMIAVTLIVMAVPEGLPMAVTLSLTLNMRRMLATNNLVRKMHACETMGAVTVICTDKTGTLTQNMMKVDDIYGNEQREDLLFQNMAVNSTALLNHDGTFSGNPTESALLRHLKEHNTDYLQMRQQAHIISQLPFSTERKMMGTLISNGDSNILFLKGAPEYIIELCGLAPSQMSDIQAKLKQYQESAMRTLAFAYLFTTGTDIQQCLKQKGFIFQGIAAIMDPIREDIPYAVKACTDAHIKIKIITGDNEKTAVEIARRIGLWTPEDSYDKNTITGQAFEKLSEEEALSILSDIKLISRARPMDKQRLVSLLQKQGEIVAVTGDGTNDAPALNQAHIGLAMGSGSAVAKEAGDITLLDDSFYSISTAVMWGRSLYKNIQRFITFQLTICLSALLISIVGAFMGTEMPLTVTQILWINLIMDTLASIAISTLPPSPSVMKEQPRKTTDFIITKRMTWFICFCAIAFFNILLQLMFYYNLWGEGSIRELTICFTIFVLLQFWNLLNVRALGTGHSALYKLSECKALLGVMAIVLFGQILIVQLGGKVFRTEPLDFTTWLILIGVSSLVLWIGEIVRLTEKFFNHSVHD